MAPREAGFLGADLCVLSEDVGAGPGSRVRVEGGKRLLLHETFVASQVFLADEQQHLKNVYI